MSVSPEEAAVSLGDIDNVQRRTRQLVRYGASSSILIGWGCLWILGFGIEHFFPGRAGRSWLVITLVGNVTTLFVTLGRIRRADIGSWDRRLTTAFVSLLGFGFIWSLLVGTFTPRQLDAFWPTLIMFGYIVAGLWLGRFLIVFGLLLTALTLIGYFWLGPWFSLWMMVVGGGGLVGGGFWLRRVGAA